MRRNVAISCQQLRIVLNVLDDNVVVLGSSKFCPKEIVLEETGRT